MIVTQVVQWLLPTPKILGSNKVTQGGNFNSKFCDANLNKVSQIYCLLSIEKTKIKKKKPGIVYFQIKVPMTNLTLFL